MNTHHLVSYDKPAIMTDDFLKTTLHYDFGTQITGKLQTYFENFQSLMDNFDPSFSLIFDAYMVLFNYLKITPKTYPVSAFLNGECLTRIGQFRNSMHLGALYENGARPLSASYWLNTTYRFTSRKHFRSVYCGCSGFSSYAGYPGYTEAAYNETCTICKQMNQDDQPSKNGPFWPDSDKRCLTTEFDQNTTISRTKRWDSSYVCGWPLVSSAAKVLGGECTTNVDVTSLKQNLHDIQEFSSQNTELIDKLEHQLSIVNERINLHYKQLQSIVDDMNDNHALFISQVNELATALADKINDNARRIQINQVAITYTNILFRIYQSVVDFRFSYSETLNALQNHYRYPSQHTTYIDPELKQRLEKAGYRIPTHDGTVPYMYSNVRYKEVLNHQFFDLDFDVYIPVVSSNLSTDRYFAAQLSPLPIQLEKDQAVYNTYSGSAICDELTCYLSPVQGFCMTDTNYWYCNRYYLATLQQVARNFETIRTHTSDFMFIPPNSIYFVKNTTYYLNNKSQQAHAGSLLVLACTSKFEDFQHKALFDISKQLNCQIPQSLKGDVFVYNSNNGAMGLELIDVYKVADLTKRYNLDVAPILNKFKNSPLNITIDTTVDQQLQDRFNSYKQNISSSIAYLHFENQRLQQQISAMKAQAYDTPIWMYLILGVLVVFILRLFRIL